MQTPETPQDKPRAAKPQPIASAVFDDGTRLEMVYSPDAGRTSFVAWTDGVYRSETRCTNDRGEPLVPFSARNNLIRHGVVLLPSRPEEYGSERELLDEIQAFIHRYVDVSEPFERIAAYYVLFTWVYDRYNELPYLRLRGDYGSGKTRFLLTVGALCYLPIFASGASTVSPLFHTIDAFRGTLIIDEADFRFSDEKSEIVKILNNGNIRGIPVLRTEVTREREYNPRAFTVFGPKLVATRGAYDDPALESRFITEEMGQRRLRRDIPFNLPSEYRDEALALRNKLLLYRLRAAPTLERTLETADPDIEPRLNQMFAPLLSIVDEARAREELRDLARAYHRDLTADRGMQVEAQVLQTVRHLAARTERSAVPLRDIAATFAEHYGRDRERPVTSKWIGGVLRRGLHLRPHKSDGIYVLPLSEQPKLDVLYERYDIHGDEIPEAAALTRDLELVIEPVQDRDIRDV